HERYVVLLPLALSQTQDDKGRVRWTLFGASEQGPAKAFWRSFFNAPRRELSASVGRSFIQNLLRTVYGEPSDDLISAGFRILPLEETGKGWAEGPLARWTTELVLGGRESMRKVRYLLTFRPFGRLPATVRKAYLAGELHLLPFPGSLVFWGAPPYARLQREFPLAHQIPLLSIFSRH